MLDFFKRRKSLFEVTFQERVEVHNDGEWMSTGTENRDIYFKLDFNK